MRKVALVLVALSLVGCGGPKAEPGQAPVQAPVVAAGESKEALNEKAFAQIQAKKYAEAVALAEQAVKLDPEFAPARFNLGLALYRMEKFAEAAPHLEAAYGKNREQVEPGWFYMLTLEKLGNVKQAAGVLIDLQARFPQDKDVAAAAERLLGVVWKQSGIVLGDLVVTTSPDSSAVVAYNRAGAEQWRFTPGAPVALLEVASPDWLLVVTDQGAELIDVTRGKSLGKAPEQVAQVTPGGKYGRRLYAGEYVYTETDFWLGGKYSHTFPKMYRLKQEAGQIRWQEIPGTAQAYRTYGDLKSGNLVASLDGRVAVVPSYDGHPLVRLDGKDQRRLKSPAAPLPAGDGLYRHEEQTISVLSTDEQLLWSRPLPPGYNLARVWPRTDSLWFVVENGANTMLFKGQTEAIDVGSGFLSDMSARHLLITAGDVTKVFDATGKHRLTLPYRKLTISDDGRWAISQEGGQLRTFRLP